MADVTEGDLVATLLRVAALSDDPLKRDVFQAMLAKGGEAFDGIPDETVRDLHSFLCGVFNGLVVAGHAWAAPMLAMLQPARGDLAAMRRALKATWNLLGGHA